MFRKMVSVCLIHFEYQHKIIVIIYLACSFLVFILFANFSVLPYRKEVDCICAYPFQLLNQFSCNFL
jgi:hypothetical protein